MTGGSKVESKQKDSSPFQTGRRVGMMRSQPVGLRPPENQWPTEKSFRPERSRPRRRNKARLP